MENIQCGEHWARMVLLSTFPLGTLNTDEMFTHVCARAQGQHLAEGEKDCIVTSDALQREGPLLPLAFVSRKLSGIRFPVRSNVTPL